MHGMNISTHEKIGKKLLLNMSKCVKVSPWSAMSCFFGNVVSYIPKGMDPTYVWNGLLILSCYNV